MKLHGFILAISTLLMLTACPTKLTTDEADVLKKVAPDAVDATVQKIGGSPVDLNNSPVDLEPLTKLPTTFARAYSPEATTMLTKSNTLPMLNSSINTALQNLRPGRVQTMQSAGLKCGNDISPPDADQDGIPDLVANYVYDCYSSVNNTQTTGAISIKDRSSGGPGPYEVHIKQFKVVDIGTNASATLNLDLDLKSSTSPYTVSQGFSLTVKPDDAGTDFVTVGFTSDTKYTPDDLQNPFNGLGLLNINASFNFAYKITDSASGAILQSNKTFKIVANVHRNKNCPNLTGGDVEMNSGTIEFSDGAGGFVKTTFGSCISKNWVWTKNGS